MAATLPLPTALEAARYALLMRIAPALRHGLFGQMQAIQFLGEILVRRSRTDGNLAQSAELLAKLPVQTKNAIDGCHAITWWFKAGATDLAEPAIVVAEIERLLDVELTLRGIQLECRCEGPPMQVVRDSLAFVVAASLIALADESTGSTLLRLDGESTGKSFDVRITAVPQGPSDEAPALAYRRLTWEDVRTLAQSAAVECSRTDDSVQLRFRGTAA